VSIWLSRVGTGVNWLRGLESVFVGSAEISVMAMRSSRSAKKATLDGGRSYKLGYRTTMRSFRNALWLVCLVVPVGALDQHVQVSTLSDASKNCPHAFAMGCVLHALTKVCAASNSMELCHFHGDCAHLRPVKEASRLFAGEDAAIWKCCCPPSSYPNGCKVEEREATCVTAIQKRLIDRIDPSMSRLKKCAKRKRQSICERAKSSVEKLITTLQEARERLRTSDPFCKAQFTAAQPFSKCGWTVRPVPRPLGRMDLECEAREWQIAHNASTYTDKLVADPLLCGGGDL
jgi:hypothetical protein